MQDLSEDDLDLLQRCVELAAAGLKQGNSPYGALLVDRHGAVVFEGHNLDGTGDLTQHPELAIARFAAATMSPEERALARVYTSTEHCPMCAAAHALVGLGTIYCASIAAEVSQWYRLWGAANPPVRTIPATEISPNLKIIGPAPIFSEALFNLHHWFHLGNVEKRF